MAGARKASVGRATRVWVRTVGTLGLIWSLGACVGASGTASSSASFMASTVQPSDTASRQLPPSPSPTRIPTPTPAQTPVGGVSWQHVGSMRFGGIIAVPNGYLASCNTVESSDDLALCSSRDLVTWKSPPDADLYVNAGGRPLLPGEAVPVKSGYGARAGGTGANRTEWYSPDGVHWQEGIPASEVVPGSVGPCLPDESQSTTGCASLVFVVSDPRSPVALVGIDRYVSTAGGGIIYTHILVSKDGWSTWQEVTLPDPLWQMYSEPQVLPDGTWIAICSVMPGPLPPGYAYGGNPDTVFIASKDGIHWQTLPDVHGAAHMPSSERESSPPSASGAAP